MRQGDHTIWALTVRTAKAFTRVVTLMGLADK